jgi:putative acetyltransferase
MARAVEWARNSGVVTRIELDVYVENARARHLYEKFGFEVEGRRRRAIFRDGQYHDDLIMGLLL